MAIEQSEILLRPLSPQPGGVSHTGGVFFRSRDDEDWKMLRDWAIQVQGASPLSALVKTAGQTFFEDRVMPKLLQRGCALEGCHSPTASTTSACVRARTAPSRRWPCAATTRRWSTSSWRSDSVDVKQSRAVKKNIAPASGGIVHRAGPLLEDTTPIDTPCPQPFDPR
jgi:hypothetical protein